MTLPSRALSILGALTVVPLGATVFVVACGVPLPTAPTDEAAPSSNQAAQLEPGPAPSTAQTVGEPEFTPMTVRPALANAADVRNTLIAEYPALLRDAGIGGAPILWIHIDESGAVDDPRVFESSGHEALDLAAMNVARAMIFRPAMHLDAPTAVWVQIPIRFQP